MRRYALAVVAMLIACNPPSRAGGPQARLAPDTDGPIRLHPENPHSFRFRGQPPSLIGSTEHSGAVLNGAFDAIPYLDESQRQGFNSPGKLGGQTWGDHLFQARQPIQDPTRCIGRQRAMSSWHASPGLVAWVLSKPKVTGGWTLRPFRRYCH